MAAAAERRWRIPTLAAFLDEDFKPYEDAHFKAKPKTAGYYD